MIKLLIVRLHTLIASLCMKLEQGYELGAYILSISKLVFFISVIKDYFQLGSLIIELQVYISSLLVDPNRLSSNNV